MGSRGSEWFYKGPTKIYGLPWPGFGDHLVPEKLSAPLSYGSIKARYCSNFSTSRKVLAPTSQAPKIGSTPTFQHPIPISPTHPKVHSLPPTHFNSPTTSQPTLPVCTLPFLISRSLKEVFSFLSAQKKAIQLTSSVVGPSFRVLLQQRDDVG